MKTEVHIIQEQLDKIKKAQKEWQSEYNEVALKLYNCTDPEVKQNLVLKFNEVLSRRENVQSAANLTSELEKSMDLAKKNAIQISQVNGLQQCIKAVQEGCDTLNSSSAVDELLRMANDQMKLTGEEKSNLPSEYLSALNQLKDYIQHLEKIKPVFELLNNLKVQLNTINPKDKGYSTQVTGLMQTIERITTSHLQKEGVGAFEKPKSDIYVANVVQAINNAKPHFEPLWWHAIADAVLRFVNGLKEIGQWLGMGTNHRYTLFSEQGAEASIVNHQLRQVHLTFLAKI